MTFGVCVCVCVVCVRMCVRACVRACVRVCVRACVSAAYHPLILDGFLFVCLLDFNVSLSQ